MPKPNGRSVGQTILEDKWNVFCRNRSTWSKRNAIKAMNQVNIDITNQTSDIIDATILNSADLVVTLCSHADAVCPSTPPHVNRVHWGRMIQQEKSGLNFNVFAMKLVNV